MRVLFVSPFFEPAWAMGGMATAPAAWAYALKIQGIEVEVFTTNADKRGNLSLPLGIPLDRDGLAVTYFARYPWSGNRFVSLKLLDACRRKIPSFDCIHAVGLWTFPSVIASTIAEGHHIPTILSLHGSLMTWAYGRHRKRKQLFLRLIEGKRIATAAATICCSELEAQHFRRLGLAGKVEVISNVVRPAKIDLDTARQDFRRQHGLEEALVLLFAGRIVTNKGLHLTLNAFALVASQIPQARLVIVGPAEDESSAALQQQMRFLGLENRIVFLGLLSGNAYWQAIAGADLFLLNSYSENFGMAPAEALALGVPVLLSDQVGIANLVKEYRAGVVTPLDVMAIAQGMQEMLSDHAALHQMGQNGARLARERFSPSAVGARFVDLIEDVVRRHQALG